MRKMKMTEFEEVYQMMEKAFIAEERRTKMDQAALLSQEEYTLYVWIDEEIYAFCAVWEFENFRFLEHFAVKETRRSGGIGSKIIAELCAMSDKPMILEVEPPSEEIARRRIGFYERNGFVYHDFEYTQPRLSAGSGSIPLKLMSYPRALSAQELEQVKQALYQKVYSI